MYSLKNTSNHVVYQGDDHIDRYYAIKEKNIELDLYYKDVKLTDLEIFSHLKQSENIVDWLIKHGGEIEDIKNHIIKIDSYTENLKHLIYLTQEDILNIIYNNLNNVDRIKLTKDFPDLLSKLKCDLIKAEGTPSILLTLYTNFPNENLLLHKIMKDIKNKRIPFGEYEQYQLLSFCKISPNHVSFFSDLITNPYVAFTWLKFYPNTNLVKYLTVDLLIIEFLKTNANNGFYTQAIQQNLNMFSSLITNKFTAFEFVKLYPSYKDNMINLIIGTEFESKWKEL